MADTIGMLCTRPAKNQTITVTVPEGFVQMLDWIAANVKNTDGSPKYLYGLNVIFKDVEDLLLPHWKEIYKNGQKATLQAQLSALDAQLEQTITADLQALTVVGP